ncbi:MAG: hypothetical protein GF330_07425 [Candidatus Eisenbacteria bacterium]|nr:hypothetical protein [Candidatus Eisenbacteria bacterium]
MQAGKGAVPSSRDPLPDRRRAPRAWCRWILCVGALALCAFAGADGPGAVQGSGPGTAQESRLAAAQGNGPGTARASSPATALRYGPRGVPEAHLGSPPREFPHQCRFWGLVGRGYPDSLVSEHLRSGEVASLRALADENPDGWGVGFFAEPAIALPALRPIVRRGGPAANDPGEADFERTIAELLASRPACAMAHVRNGSSGHLGIPDPHPFLMRVNGRELLFAHNGGLSEAALIAELEKYIETHPLDYVEGIGATGPIDSELYFFFLQRFIETHPELSLADALPAALAELLDRDEIVGSRPHLNFLLTDGDTLFALHYYEGADNPVRYWPAGQSASPYWAVASEPLGSSDEWGTVPARAMATFVPGAPPAFVAIPDPAAPRTRTQGGAPPPRPRPAATPTARAGRGRAAVVPAATGAEPPHNCRFWALVGEGYPATLIESHLAGGAYQNLRDLGGRNPDGWALGYEMHELAALDLVLPVLRRGGPAAPLDDDFSRAVAEMREVAPRTAVGHVRAATTGHIGIPDPHPFRHAGILFAHNGTLAANVLEERLGDYLDGHALDYGYGLPSTGPVDSELYLLYLLSLIEQARDAHPDSAMVFADALHGAVQTVAADLEITGARAKMNFVLTRGDTLYALHYYDPGSFNPVRYYPALDGRQEIASPFWVAASEQLGDTPAGWGELPARTLAIFVPGERPRLLPVGGSGLSFAALEIVGTVDADEDGWLSRFDVRCDPEVAGDSARVGAEVWVRETDGEWWSHLASAAPRWIRPLVSDTLRIDCVVDSLDAGLPASELDLKVILRAGGDSTVATPGSHPILAAVALESSLADQTSDLPRELTYEAIARRSELDDDGDGYVSRFDLQVEVGLSIPGDSARARLRVIAAHGSSYFEIARSGERWVVGGLANAFRLPIVITPEDEPAAQWEFALELQDLETQEPPVRAWARDYPALADVPVEGPLQDTAGWAGVVRPNPAGVGEVPSMTIPILVPPEGARVSAELFDLCGRRIWTWNPGVLEGGRGEMAWGLCDQTGRRVSAGVYFATVRVAERIWQRRFVVLR